MDWRENGDVLLALGDLSENTDCSEDLLRYGVVLATVTESEYKIEDIVVVPTETIIPVPYEERYVTKYRSLGTVEYTDIWTVIS